MKNYYLISIALILRMSLSMAQSNDTNTFTRADTLRGMLTPLRICYDVTYYHLDVKVNPATQFISGSNTIQFKATKDFKRMQIDLVENMEIDKIIQGNKQMKFERELGAVYINFPEMLKANSTHNIQVFYSGKPKVSARPPWDGGFTWTMDKSGNTWVAVTVQGDGAYLWWPNKEHQSDEPDSMLISITIPDDLMNISNGCLRNKTGLGNGWTKWDWFVSYPINNYNVTLNIAKYSHFDDIYINENGDTLRLDYYVLPYNIEKAKKQFQQVKSMLTCFEKLFGKYPFYRDGYKLVESPHNGMEHQSAIAYGNDYRNGYRSRASSEYGLMFDFIIIHESSHEWWGNSMTSKDIADMWIHESFGAYAEALYVECMYGYDAYLKYQNGKKFGVRNNRPIIGVYNVNNAGSGDMYNKGSLVLHTLRNVIDNDSLWFDIIYGIQDKFKYQTVTANDIFNFINKETGKDYSYFFDQYFKHTSIPELRIIVTKQGDKVTARYRWRAEVKNFKMPIKVTTGKDKYEFIYPTTAWQTTVLGDINPHEFKVAEHLFYVNVDLRLSYLLSVSE
ncbi:MAG: M1 family metallopeptidase [Bacteroidales bacterium]|nr:M1 family metallopeptidase [Bacteroidales bacterium]